MRFVHRPSRHLHYGRFLGAVVAGMALFFFIPANGNSQTLGKRRAADSDSEIPSAVEIGSSSMPVIDGKPLHPPTVDTPARQTKKQPSKKTVSKPSFLGRIGTSTKRFFSATGELFRFHRTETTSRIVQNTGWQQPAKPVEKKSWFGSLFEAEKPEPATPQEWLSQPRPKMF